MSIATAARNSSYSSQRRQDATRLLVLGEGVPVFSFFGAIERFLREGDLIVVNRSATFPASFEAALNGKKFEIRLAARESEREWLAFAFGPGSWRQPTEERISPPRISAGDLLQLGPNFSALVKWVDPERTRFLRIRLEGNAVLGQIYRHGQPVQYSYHREPLALWDLQTLFSGAPLSVEPPSALFPLSGERLLALRKRHSIVSLLHGAGLSSTGDPEHDALLPLPEPFHIPRETLEAVKRAKQEGRRVLAIGTTVVRALETAFGFNPPLLEGVSKLRLNEESRLKVIDGLLTGFHDLNSSHFELEGTFQPKRRLEWSAELARRAGFLGHEFGDLVLLWRTESV